MRAAKSSHDVTTARYRPVCAIDLKVIAFFRKWGRDSSVLGPLARPILTAPRAVDRFALLRCGLTVLCRSVRLCGALHDAVGRLEPASLLKSGGVRCSLRECVCHEHRALPVRCPMGSAIASGDFILYIYNNMLYDISILKSQISCMSASAAERSRTGAGPFPFAGAPDHLQVRGVAPAPGAVWVRLRCRSISACPVWTMDGRCPRILA